jgi:hypothetical protein
VGSPFRIVEESPGVFRVYVFHVGTYPTGTREDAERLLRSLEHERAEWNKLRDAELTELRELLARAIEVFGPLADAESTAPTPSESDGGSERNKGGAR